MNWGANGTSFALGKVAEKANAFEIGLDAYDKYGARIANGVPYSGGWGLGVDANTTIESLIMANENAPETTGSWIVETMFRGDRISEKNRKSRL